MEPEWANPSFPRAIPHGMVITDARTGRELELLRSHPKDERGSVREIGLCHRWDQPCFSAGYPPRYGDY